MDELEEIILIDELTITDAPVIDELTITDAPIIEDAMFEVSSNIPAVRDELTITDAPIIEDAMFEVSSNIPAVRDELTITEVATFESTEIIETQPIREELEQDTIPLAIDDIAVTENSASLQIDDILKRIEALESKQNQTYAEVVLAALPASTWLDFPDSPINQIVDFRVCNAIGEDLTDSFAYRELNGKKQIFSLTAYNNLIFKLEGHE